MPGISEGPGPRIAAMKSPAPSSQPRVRNPRSQRRAAHELVDAVIDYPDKTMDPWYSTQPLLAWCLNRYFYDDRHYAYLATPFHPYRLQNPPSSRPMEIYQRLYEGAHDRDIYNDTIRCRRLGLRAGVDRRRTMLGALATSALHRVIDTVDPILFTPIVYRVNLDAIPDARKRWNAGTRTTNTDSRECLIEELRPVEFDILLLAHNAPDISYDPHINSMARPLVSSTLPAPSPAEIIALLLSRCS